MVGLKKKKILIHSIAFSPDGVSTAYIYNDIALGFRRNGYDVVVLSTTPHYNIIQSELEKQPLRKYWLGLFYKSDFNGIPVYHVPQKKFKSFGGRVAGFIYWHIVSFILGLCQKNLSLILSPSPPLTIALVSIFLAKIKRAGVVYNVQEIYPDFLINQGSLKSGLLVTLLKRMETFVYNHSDRVTTIDEVFYQTIVSRFDNPAKLIIIPNFVDTKMYNPLAKDAMVLDKKAFPHKPVLKVMYAGNIGHAQDWEPLLRVAQNLKNEPIEFWVIGEGVLKEIIQQEIVKTGLTNIHLLPYQPREKMSDIINFADIHFIFMNPQMEGQGFPSKVYTIMACKKPLLVVSGEKTPLYQFLKDKKCAFLVTESDIVVKCREIESILTGISKNGDTLNSMGQNGYEIVQTQYACEVIVKQYINLADLILE